MSEYLSGKDYRIIIVEQDNRYLFNAGMIRNIGFLEACKKYPQQDYFIFNDVDIVPVKIENDDCLDFGHPGNNIINHLYGMAHCIGGVYSISKNTFEKINGYPTGYWGWGFEDTDLWHYRIKPNKIRRIGPIYKRGQPNSKFADISRHHRDIRNRPNNKELFFSKKSPGGLDSMEYQVTDDTYDPDQKYHHIKCDFMCNLEK
jgi:hypothetical protein